MSRRAGTRLQAARAAAVRQLRIVEIVGVRLLVFSGR